MRRFALPIEIDATKVQAEFKNGVLNVHLPKTAKAPRKRSTSRLRDVRYDQPRDIDSVNLLPDFRQQVHRSTRSLSIALLRS